MANNVQLNPGQGGALATAYDLAGTTPPTTGVAGCCVIYATPASGTSPRIATLANPLFVEFTDGTNTPVIATPNAALAENAAHWLQVASILCALDTGASAGSQAVQALVESSAHPNLRVARYNGANETPAGDQATRSVFVATGDNTNAFLSGSAANLAAGVGTNAQLTVKPGMWTSVNTSTAAGTATVTKTAGGSGVKFVVDSITVSLAAGAAAQTPLTATLVQDSGGTPVTLWAASLAAPADGCGAVSASGLNIIQTVANKTLTLAFSGAGTTNTIQSVSMSGYLSS